MRKGFTMKTTSFIIFKYNIYTSLFIPYRNTMNKMKKCNKKHNDKLVITPYIECSKQFRFQQETGNEKLAGKQIGV